MSSTTFGDEPYFLKKMKLLDVEFVLTGKYFFRR